MRGNVGLCLGCMNKLDDLDRCHYCNFDNNNISQVTPFLTPGTVLDDRYIVGRVLTYNGEGVSYISYDKVTNEKVVVREYLPDTLCKREDSSDRVIVNAECLAKYKTFMSEFAEVYKILSRLRNLPHIVPAIDMFAQNNTTYAVLDYVEGVSLRKFLCESAGMLTWDNVKKLFPPIFTTISLIHNAGIIHRGICPDNILISTKGELKLIGFSISSIRTFNTELNAELYSGYAAPEQYTSLDWQGTWTDVYSISAVLYRVLTGTVPPEAPGRNVKDTLIEPIRINPRIPP
ncbi:MAG: protein kinase, partial [Clostridiales bacterium]|nr:protein kinase [Clostridiales bacterium]